MRGCTHYAGGDWGNVIAPNYTNSTNFYHRDKQQFQVLYSKTWLKWSLKNIQNKGLYANGNLMKVKSIAECSPWSILQYV